MSVLPNTPQYQQNSSAVTNNIHSNNSNTNSAGGAATAVVANNYVTESQVLDKKRYKEFSSRNLKVFFKHFSFSD